MNFGLSSVTRPPYMLSLQMYGSPSLRVPKPSTAVLYWLQIHWTSCMHGSTFCTFSPSQPSLCLGLTGEDLKGTSRPVFCWCRQQTWMPLGQRLWVKQQCLTPSLAVLQGDLLHDTDDLGMQAKHPQQYAFMSVRLPCFSVLVHQSMTQSLLYPDPAYTSNVHLTEEISPKLLLRICCNPGPGLVCDVGRS